MAHKQQPYVQATRDGHLLHVIPYASDGWHKRRQQGITVDLRDKPAATEQLVAHIDKIREQNTS